MCGRTKMTPSSTESVSLFYTDRSIFVTGATGFMGKVLIEKLLRSCPDVREIFLLLRPLKGMSIDDRLKKMLDLPLFDILRETRPSAFEKLIPVTGDVSLDGLGLAEHDKHIIYERVSIIFHAAANVRFEDNLKRDILTNTKSTNNICILAQNIKNLVAFVHVSSAYTQCDKQVVQEIEYPAEADSQKTLQIAETFDERTLRIFSPKYCGVLPNTYTFSKRLAEQVVSQYSNQLPIVLIRPSIVVPTAIEPFAGWIDNFNGPIGMMIAGGKGILRVVWGNDDAITDYVPVDVAIKLMIVAACKRAKEPLSMNPRMPVYHSTSGGIKGVSGNQLMKLGFKCNEKAPVESPIWYPSAIPTNSPFLYYILVLIMHLLPAVLIDLILKITGRRPLLVRLHTKIYGSVVSIGYFVRHQWNFRNEKSLAVLMEQSNQYGGFGFDFQKFDIVEYFTNCLIGAKKFLLREELTNVHKSRIYLNRMWWIDSIFKWSMGIIFVWILSRTSLFINIFDSYRSTLNAVLFEGL